MIMIEWSLWAKVSIWDTPPYPLNRSHDTWAAPNTTQKSTAQDNTAQHRTKQHIKDIHSTDKHNTKQQQTTQDGRTKYHKKSTTQCRKVKHRTVLQSTEQHSTALHNTATQRTTQNRTTQHCKNGEQYNDNDWHVANIFSYMMLRNKSDWAWQYLGSYFAALPARVVISAEPEPDII